MSAPWVRTYAAHFTSTAPLADPPAIEYAASQAHERLASILTDAGAEAVGPLSLAVTDSHAAFSQPPLTSVLCETRAIRLRNPSPFPRLRLFGWLPR